MEYGWISSLPRTAALLSLGIGSTLLLVWVFDSAVHSLLDDLITIKPGIGASFVLGGASLLMLVRGRRAYAWCRFFAAVLLALVGVTWTIAVRTEAGVITTETARVLHAFGFTLQAAALLLLTSERFSVRRIGAD